MGRHTASMIGLAAALLLGVAPAAAAAASPWRVVASPNQGSGGNRLDAVAAITPSNVWAVGEGSRKLLAEHWNGHAWAIVPTAVSGVGEYDGISAPAANDIWLDGYSGHNEIPFIEHYDGHTWSVLLSTPPGVYVIDWISATSATDVWVEAAYYQDSTANTLVYLERWNGHTWTAHLYDTVSVENGFSFGQLDALSASDVWLVGSDNYPDGSQAFTDHWNGSTIQHSQGPQTSPSDYLSLIGVGGSSPTDVWEVGDYGDYETPAFGALAGFWNGSHWTTELPTVYSTCCHSLNAVAVGSPTDVWAMGNRFSGGGSNPPELVLAEHWNGHAWAEYGGPNPATTQYVNGVSVAPGTESFWMVGSTGRNGGQRTLVMRCC